MFQDSINLKTSLHLLEVTKEQVVLGVWEPNLKINPSEVVCNNSQVSLGTRTHLDLEEE